MMPRGECAVMPRRNVRIPKLATLHEAGFLADDESFAKKAELPARFDIPEWVRGRSACWTTCEPTISFIVWDDEV
jgi:hypothetical protein